MDLFSFVIVQARKPAFFTDNTSMFCSKYSSSRPFFFLPALTKKSLFLFFISSLPLPLLQPLSPSPSLPIFFSEVEDWQETFYEKLTDQDKFETIEISTRHLYGFGNYKHQIKSFMDSVGPLKSGRKEPRVCYVGDHLITDLQAPKMAGWETIAIIEEIELEAQKTSPFYDGMEKWGSFFGTPEYRSYFSMLIDKITKRSYASVQHLAEMSLE